MDVNLPSINELSQMQFLDPNAYTQAQSNIDLANKFQQQNLRQGEADLQTKTLANIYNEQNNPLKIENQRLMNAHQGLTNRGLGVTTRISEGTEDEQKAAAREKWLAGASEDQLKGLQAKAEALGIRGAALVAEGDPSGQDMVDKAKRMHEAAFKTLDERQKQKAEQEKTETIYGAKAAIAGGQNASREEVARINAEARKLGANAKTATDFETNIVKYAHNPVAAAEARIAYADKLEAAGDVAGANFQRKRAIEARQRAAEEQANIGARTPGLDIPTIANQPAKARPVANAPVGEGGAPPAQSSTTSQIPVGGYGVQNQVSRSQQKAMDDGRVQILMQELQKPEISPGDHAAVRAELKRMGVNVGAPAAKQTIPQAPAGKVYVVNPQGKGGFIPQSQLEQALKSGYTQK